MKWTSDDERRLRTETRRLDEKRRREAAHTPHDAESGQTAAEYYGWDDDPTPLGDVPVGDLQDAFERWERYVNGETFAEYVSFYYGHEGVADASWDVIADVIGVEKSALFEPRTVTYSGGDGR